MNRHKHPELYMKRAYHKTYFEGWYYKQVNATRSHSISFIPSVSFTKDSSTAYLQVIYQNGDNLITDICEYDISDFAASKDDFLVTTGDSCFSDKELKVNFRGKSVLVSGLIEFSNLTKLGYSLLNPNIMGFFSYIPFMHCNHGVISMHHSLSGTLNINGEIISFDDGIGYIEKDWGSSFPEKYVWLQCNHFKTEGASLMFSVAYIYYFIKCFEGFICNLLLDGKQYRFATYTGAKLKINIEQDTVNVLINDKKYSLKIIASSKESRALYAPKNGLMNHTINEGLRGDIEIELVNRQTNQVIYKDSSDHVSIEIIK